MRALVSFVDLSAMSLLVIGLWRMRRPETAAGGSLVAGAGMFAALASVLVARAAWPIHSELAALVVGAVVGGLIAFRARLPDLPGTVALLTGLGGLATALVAVDRFGAPPADAPAWAGNTALALAASVGATTFSGSLAARARLRVREPALRSDAVAERRRPGLMTIRLRRPATLNAAIALVAVAIAAAAIASSSPYGLIALCAVAAVLGVTATLPFAVADLPVAISLFDASAGLASAALGVATASTALVVAGALVASSGVIAIAAMCRAMNRSLAAVWRGDGFDGVDGLTTPPAPEEPTAPPVVPMIVTDVDEVASILRGVRSVVIVPGTGLALAGAQDAVGDLYRVLTRRGTRVELAIHPIAGRMPGHLDVLLATARVPRTACVDVAVMNSRFSDVDVVLVVGAHDVVNPAQVTAGTGMTILEVARARAVVVIKRGRTAGPIHSGTRVDNPLFTCPNTRMLFGDARIRIQELTRALSRARTAPAHAL